MVTKHSGGGTPRKNAMWLRQLARFAEGQNREFKAEELNRIATEIEQTECELAAARSALAEKEREVEKNTIERCAKAAADVPHSTPFASRVITACVVAIRSLKSAPPASPTGRKE